MAKILDFRIPKPNPIDQYFDDMDFRRFSSTDAINRILSQLTCHVMPMWIEKGLPFRGLEMLVDELRTTMMVRAPEYVLSGQIDSIVDELKPIWTQICEKADDYL
jgi:hypothetical protein